MQSIGQNLKSKKYWLMTECTEQKNMFVLDCISENVNKYEIVESNYLEEIFCQEKSYVKCNQN